MISPPKFVSFFRPVGQLAGAVFFFLIIPFGMLLGVVLRLFGGTHRKRDRVL